MQTLPTALRQQLERAIIEARKVAEAGARAALKELAVHHREFYEHMDTGQRHIAPPAAGTRSPAWGPSQRTHGRSYH